MRNNEGRPDDAIMPLLTIEGDHEPLGHIVTIINKQAAYSKVPELRHLYLKTNDPEQRRKKALELFSETYYQKANEFSEVLTATFKPASEGAQKIIAAGKCQLKFEAYNQTFLLSCNVERLDTSNHHYQATLAHNQLFNSNLNPDTIILGFTPDWEACSADQ